MFYNYHMKYSKMHIRCLWRISPYFKNHSLQMSKPLIIYTSMQMWTSTQYYVHLTSCTMYFIKNMLIIYRCKLTHNSFQHMHTLNKDHAFHCQFTFFLYKNAKMQWYKCSSFTGEVTSPTLSLIFSLYIPHLKKAGRQAIAVSYWLISVSGLMDSGIIGCHWT